MVLIIIIPCYIAQGMANFSYGNEAVANSPGTPVYEAEQQMNAKFGKSNMMIALVPPDSNITEKKMTEEIQRPVLRQVRAQPVVRSAGRHSRGFPAGEHHQPDALEKLGTRDHQRAFRR